LNHRASHVQSLRESIVNIRDPVTISFNFRASSPPVLEQSGNPHMEKTKTVSSRQLKSGSPNIKTATTMDMETLRQFAEDWEHGLGHGASVRIPTSGILAHGIRTSSKNQGYRSQDDTHTW
ncbi:hypothetical protein EDB80DRAFT_590172, partial [Ilyonectria destructans]